MKTLLIADDNEQILDVLKQYAHKEGYHVYTAKTGTQALEQFARREYHAGNGRLCGVPRDTQRVNGSDYYDYCARGGF